MSGTVTGAATAITVGVAGAAAHRARLRATLDAFLAAADRAALAHADPVSLVRPFEDPHDREVAGFLVAMLAYGRVAAIRKKSADLLDRLGPEPAERVDRGRAPLALRGFVYRFQRGDDLPRLARAIGRVRRASGSLGAAFVEGADPADVDYGPAMAALVARVRGAIRGPLTYGLRFLLPDPASGGAAKRLCLFTRWMVRPDDGVDLGVWSSLGLAVQPAKLLVPLDTHMARIARYIGLTERRTNDLEAARQITRALRALRPEDPVAYDLALCHLGISGACPRRRDRDKCAGCPIRSICRLGPEPAGW